MARMPAVVEELAGLDGRPYPAIDAYARYLRAAGHITPGGRGHTAPHASGADVANLLISTLATDSPSVAPRLLKIFRELKPVAMPVPKQTPRMFELLLRLPTLGEFVEATLDNAIALRLTMGDLGFDLTIGRTIPAARLALRDPMGRRAIAMEWAMNPRSYEGDMRLPLADRGADRRLSAAISQTSVYRLGAILEHECLEAA